MMVHRILCITAAVLSLARLSLAAEPPLCSGKNMLAELATSAPRLSARLMTAEKIIPNGQAILWRITDKTGKAPPSHLFGTIHLTDPRVHALPDAVRDAIDKASRVALEAKEAVDPTELARAFLRNGRFTAMPLGQDMWDLIPDADESFIRSAPQIPEERMITLGSVQPWVTTFSLSYPMCEIARQKAGLPFLDRAIGQMALARGIPVVGLEKIEEQLAVLAGAPLEDQARLLVAVAKYGKHLEDMMETYEQLYLERRISSLWLLSMQGVPSDEIDPRIWAYMEDMMINKRNRLMLERSLPLLASGNTFIAVGAAHLPGDQGLVELIRKAGYEVTPVN
jgi:uncharacterized protein YbaP (TraB family)